jgi:hypothetical protein
MDDYIAKPITLQAVAEVVDSGEGRRENRNSFLERIIYFISKTQQKSEPRIQESEY